MQKQHRFYFHPQIVLLTSCSGDEDIFCGFSGFRVFECTIYCVAFAVREKFLLLGTSWLIQSDILSFPFSGNTSRVSLISRKKNSVALPWIIEILISGGLLLLACSVLNNKHCNPFRVEFEYSTMLILYPTKRMRAQIANETFIIQFHFILKNKDVLALATWSFIYFYKIYCYKVWTGLKITLFGLIRLAADYKEERQLKLNLKSSNIWRTSKYLPNAQVNLMTT